MSERVESYRLYSCRGCNVSVSICGSCDRGNIYCGGECAIKARRASRQRAGARYQRTHRGARQHAARQQAWRKRRCDKVTHQGCAPNTPVFTMPVAADVAVIEPHDALPTPEPANATPSKHNRAAGSPHRVAGRCDFCHAPLPLFTRYRTLRGWGFG